MNANVYQHFRKDEHPFIDQVHGWLEQVDSQYAPYLTDFLDPRQMFILEAIVKRDSHLPYSFYGGYVGAERSRGMIYPDYYEPKEEDYQVVLYEIRYPQKFGSLSHGKILGTLLNLGIRREFFGDIISDGIRWQFFVNQEVASFIENQVTKIGSFTVRLESIDNTEVITPTDSWEIEQTTVSSLRLDTVIASVFNISRQRAKTMIETNKVKVNWQEIDRTDFTLGDLDIISVRGFGRLQLKELLGKSKKDKYKVQIGVLRK